MSERVGKWLEAEERPSASGKTSIWRLIPVASTALPPWPSPQTLVVGFVGWYGKWRRYALQPEPNSVFEQDCLRAIADFCEAKTCAHREAKRTR